MPIIKYVAVHGSPLKLHENKIRSEDDFKSVVGRAEDRCSRLFAEKKKLEDKISDEEKILEDYPRYKELVGKNSVTKLEREELRRLVYLADRGVFSDDDFEEHKKTLAHLKSQAESLDDEIADAKSEADRLTDYYSTYTRQMKSEFDVLLEKAREEQERIRQAEEIEEETIEQERKYYYEK